MITYINGIFHSVPEWEKITGKLEALFGHEVRSTVDSGDENIPSPEDVCWAPGKHDRKLLWWRRGCCIGIKTLRQATRRVVIWASDFVLLGPIGNKFPGKTVQRPAAAQQQGRGGEGGVHDLACRSR